ncbi:MAG TPA: hypothetical protein ENJ82_18195, partial [Bacteroidetes bacterium]|nr:hypothetical protein [Bacteroidota bacterium]
MEKQAPVNAQKSSLESESDTSAGISMAPPEFSVTAGVAQAKMMAPVQRQATSSDPITDAVAAIKASSSNTGANYLSERLVRGIVQAEAMFLRENPLNRWAEGLGFADTIGAGQLGEPAITDVDNQFGAAITAFAKSHGAAPTDWKGKATHAEWQYFYTAAYLARSLQEAERIFQPNSPVLTNNQIGIVDIGIAIYHGAFSTIRNLRRRVAK